MSLPKTALLSILVACWIVGLFNQFHEWGAVARYLVLSLLIVAIVAAKRQYQMAYAKSRTDRRRP
jgi:hypothetical protein